MPHVISDDCISCGLCADECPTESISEGDEHYVVNPDTCIDCDKCAEICPVGAPSGPKVEQSE